MSNPCHSQGIHRIWLCSFQRSRAGRPRRNIWPQVSQHPWRTSTPAKSTSLHTNAASHRGDVWSYTWGILGVKLESGTFKFRIASLMSRGYDLCYCGCFVKWFVSIKIGHLSKLLEVLFLSHQLLPPVCWIWNCRAAPDPEVMPDSSSLLHKM